MEDAEPSPDWTVDQLGEYARVQDDLCVGLGRKMAIHRFREGHALTLAYKKIGYGGWMAYLAKHGISHSGDARARKLWEKAKTEKNLDGLTIMEAYEKYGIEPKQAKAKRTTGTKSPRKSGASPKRRPKVGDSPEQPEDHTPSSKPPEVHDAGARAESAQILERFNKFAASKGWDEDRKAQVVAELSFPEAVKELIGEVAAAGYGDEWIDQLHQYYEDEPDYLSWLLSKLIAVSQESEVTDNALALVDRTIEQLAKIRKAAAKEQAA